MRLLPLRTRHCCSERPIPPARQCSSPSTFPRAALACRDASTLYKHVRSASAPFRRTEASRSPRSSLCARGIPVNRDSTLTGFGSARSVHRTCSSGVQQGQLVGSLTLTYQVRELESSSNVPSGRIPGRVSMAPGRDLIGIEVHSADCRGLRGTSPCS